MGGGLHRTGDSRPLRALGLEVTLLEATRRVLERVTAPEVSEFFDRIHREEGVNIRTGTLVEALSGDGRVREVILASGESPRRPRHCRHRRAEHRARRHRGLVVDNGVVIDDRARTSDPDIVAAGDCASHDMARYGRRIRLESVPSAAEQAKVATATVCGKSKKIAALPWFWPINTTSSSRSPVSTPGTTRSSSAATRPGTATSPASTSVPASSLPPTASTVPATSW